jgi:hypothetical protein
LCGRIGSRTAALRNKRPEHKADRESGWWGGGETIAHVISPVMSRCYVFYGLGRKEKKINKSLWDLLDIFAQQLKLEIDAPRVFLVCA